VFTAKEFGNMRAGAAAEPRTVSHWFAEALASLGVEHAFGVFGGAIAPFAQALSRCSIPRNRRRARG
jgi:hypothetical protein